MHAQRSWWFAVVVPLAGCSGEGWLADGGQSGTEIPTGCAEVRREPIADRAAIPEGMAWSPDDVAAGFAGAWSGPWTDDAGGDASFGLALTLDGDVERIVMAQYGPGAGGSMAGAPTGSGGCSDTYALYGEAVVALQDQLDERLDASVVANDPAVGMLLGEAPLESLSGDAVPPWDPAKWSTNALQIDATFAAGTGAGSLTWLGTNTQRGSSTATATGTIAPSGESAWIGSFTLAR